MQSSYFLQLVGDILLLSSSSGNHNITYANIFIGFLGLDDLVGTFLRLGF